jgi:hypothetical protein
MWISRAKIEEHFSGKPFNSFSQKIRMKKIFLSLKLSLMNLLKKWRFVHWPIFYDNFSFYLIFSFSFCISLNFMINYISMRCLFILFTFIFIVERCSFSWRVKMIEFLRIRNEKITFECFWVKFIRIAK